MSEPTNGGSGAVKTFAIRVPNALHAQFSLIATLENWSLNDAGVAAIQLLVDTKRADGDFNGRAATALAEIQREAEARQTAIQALLGEEPAADGSASKRRARPAE